MVISEKEIIGKGLKFFVESEGKEVARAYLYILNNDLHKEPFGFMEDVFVDESLRGQGVGTMLVNHIVVAAKKFGCYKLVATSRLARSNVHGLYEKLGFKSCGAEFRIDY